MQVVQKERLIDSGHSASVPKNVTLLTKDGRVVPIIGLNMNARLSSERGFSLIELGMVLMIVAMLTAVAVPTLLGSKDAADKAWVVASLRAMHTDQVTYHTTRGRFARLSELNAFAGGNWGKVSGTTMYKKEWIYLMSPTPTDATLRTRYNMIVYKIRSGRIVAAFSIAQDGVVSTIIP